PTWPTCRTSTCGSTRPATPGCTWRARTARASSTSTPPRTARGNDALPLGPAARGGGVPGVPRVLDLPGGHAARPPATSAVGDRGGPDQPTDGPVAGPAAAGTGPVSERSERTNRHSASRSADRA